MTLGLVDVERVGAWMDSQELEVGQSMAIEPLSGGASNVMLTIHRGESRWVLRRPAHVAVERANEGMRREYRILEALGRTAVPHPAAIALCEDPEVLGCTFYLMEHVVGVNPIPLPPQFDDDQARAEIAHAMVDALVQVHEVDWKAVGLADLGHPDQFHERQVSRWSRQLASYEGRELPGLDRVMSWLEANRPADFTPTLMHGDFHMLNALIAPERPGRVIAIVDWETATIGDPLLDLAGFCEVWCSATQDGWPSRGALIERYRSQRGLARIPELTYYDMLYNFRLAVLLEGIYQRSLRDATREDQHAVGERVIFNVARAVELGDDGAAQG